ncbi:hypothetical protein [Pseudoalteromonas lipolytica]|uniref:hypothetical protein n=1 Tax=Pseudoalteromonas lipolytica TaxID=570156 RepID=UPI0030A3C909
MTAPLILSEVKQKLASVVSESFVWPEIPKGWQLEFIVYPDGEVNMDLLHPVSGMFWSEDNGHFELPIMKNGKFITATALKDAGIPFMTTFGHAVVSEKPQPPHLKSV